MKNKILIYSALVIIGILAIGFIQIASLNLKPEAKIVSQIITLTK